MVFLRKKKLLLSPLDFSFFLKKLFCIFQLSQKFFCACCVFLFFCSVFSGVFIFFEFFQPKIFFKQITFEKILFFQLSFEFFLREGNTLNKKKRRVLIKKYHLNFLQKETFLREKLFQDPHALRIACAIEDSLDHCCVS